ncbi:MAG: hypothetical protein ACOCRX_06080, partial [Candidatus Woesearchaeota archaeon]
MNDVNILSDFIKNKNYLKVIDYIMEYEPVTKDNVKENVNLMICNTEEERENIVKKIWNYLLDNKIIRENYDGEYIINNRKSSIRELVNLRQELINEKHLQEKNIETPEYTWYLCGPMTGFPNQNYRQKLDKTLKNYNQKTIDPGKEEDNIKEFMGRIDSKTRAKARAIFKRDEYLIQKSDILVGYLPKKTTGGDMEVLYAHMIFMPTVVIIPPERKKVSPFLYKADKMFKSIEEFEDKLLSNPTILKRLFN